MLAGLSAVLAALDAAARPVDIFLRDDDAGWGDAQLLALLDCTAQAAVPIDLAVIPQACSEALAYALCARIDAAPHLLHVHQHGFAHANHELAGRKCEFGASRDMRLQRADLCAGRHRLQALFGARLDAVLTPPWNRCAPATPALLAELGYAAISRDRTAPPQAALPEVRVNVDWCRQRREAAPCGEDGLARIAAEMARHIGADAPVGLMLHHAQMDEGDLALLGQLLAALTPHPRVRWTTLRRLAGGGSSLRAVTALPFPA